MDAPTTAPAMRRPVRSFARRDLPRLSPNEVRRQGHVAIAAFTALESREEAIAFLNTHDDELGGRPLALATQSEEGMARVTAVMLTRPAAERRELLSAVLAD